MEVKNKLYPSRDQMKGFFEVADDEDNEKPIYMVNLLKFKKKAEYRDGRPSLYSAFFLNFSKLTM